MVSGKAVWMGMGSAVCLARVAGNATVAGTPVCRRVFHDNTNCFVCGICHCPVILPDRHLLHQRGKTALAMGKRLNCRTNGFRLSRYALSLTRIVRKGENNYATEMRIMRLHYDEARRP